MSRPNGFSNFYDIYENMAADDFDSWRDILCNRRISKKLLQTISNFDIGQIKQVRLGVEHKLSSEAIEFYANKKYNSEKMEQIRLGFEQGLTLSQIEMYANLTYAEEMSEMRLAILHGLSQEQLTKLLQAPYGWMPSERQQFEFMNKMDTIKTLISLYPDD